MASKQESVSDWMALAKAYDKAKAADIEEQIKEKVKELNS